MHYTPHAGFVCVEKTGAHHDTVGFAIRGLACKDARAGARIKFIVARLKSIPQETAGAETHLKALCAVGAGENPAGVEAPDTA